MTRTANDPVPDGVSLIIPAYNEESRIRTTILTYLEPLRQSGLPHEIVVVADGNDRTPEVVAGIDETVVRVLRFDHKLGKGGAVLAGFRNARFSRVGYTDADGSLSAESLSSLIRATGPYDCVFGSRWVPGSVWIARESRSKELASRLFNAIVRVTLGIEIRDTQCGAKFYSAAILKELLPKVYVNNLTTDVSFIYHAAMIHANIAEMPVTWTNRDGSRFKLGSMVGYMFLTIVGMRIVNSRVRRLVPSVVLTTIQRTVERA